MDARARDPRAAEVKLEKMAENPSALFRGTASIFFAQLQYKEGTLDGPVVTCVGDAHPRNAGVQPGAGEKAVFGINDFDEAARAPFTYDIKRLATGVALLARECGKKVEPLVEAMLRGYREALDKDGGLCSIELADAKGPVRDALEKAEEASPREFLKKHLDLDTGRFRDSAGLTRVTDSTTLAELTDAARAALAPLPHAGGFDLGALELRDAGAVTTKGVGSLGRKRWHVFVEYPSRRGKEQLIVEVKEELRSVLADYVTTPQPRSDNEATRVVEARAVELAHADPLFCAALVEGVPCIVRRVDQRKLDVAFDKLSKQELRQYAEQCGAVWANAHVASAPSAKEEIRQAVNKDGFARDVAESAERYADWFEKAYKTMMDMRKAGEL